MAFATPCDSCSRERDVLPRGPRKRIPFVLVNNYGPTECTVVATSGPVMVGIRQHSDDRKADPRRRDLPARRRWRAGSRWRTWRDLYRRSRRRARVSGLPDETRLAFLSDPFSSFPGARMYKTGDLGVRRGNGEIEFRGRIDRQVKIYGKRVELNEIDSVLARHKDISFATTQARVGSRGEIRLIAYVVAKSETWLSRRIVTKTSLRDAAIIHGACAFCTAAFDPAAHERKTRSKDAREWVSIRPWHPIDDRMAIATRGSVVDPCAGTA